MLSSCYADHGVLSVAVVFIMHGRKPKYQVRSPSVTPLLQVVGGTVLIVDEHGRAILGCQLWLWLWIWRGGRT